jgi:hypothetical protein
MTDLNALSREQLLALVATMQKQGQRKITYKVSEKGALSVYGLGRFPLTAYASQWERLIEDLDAMKAFMKANASLFSRKPV